MHTPNPVHETHHQHESKRQDRTDSCIGTSNGEKASFLWPRSLYKSERRPPPSSEGSNRAPPKRMEEIYRQAKDNLDAFCGKRSAVTEHRPPPHRLAQSWGQSWVMCVVSLPRLRPTWGSANDDDEYDIHNRGAIRWQMSTCTNIIICILASSSHCFKVINIFNVLSWKWRSSSQSTTFVMVQFDGNYQNL